MGLFSLLTTSQEVTLKTGWNVDRFCLSFCIHFLLYFSPEQTIARKPISPELLVGMDFISVSLVIS